MLNPFNQYFLNQPEPNKSCMLALKDVILAVDDEVTTSWKYRMPFFTYKGKMLCYLWTDKNDGTPYIGFAEGRYLDHPMLEKGARSRMKILRIDPEKDLPIETIHYLVKESINFLQ